MRRFLLAILTVLCTIPVSAQDMDTRVEEFLSFTDRMAQLGDKYIAKGYWLQANWFFGQSVAAVSSLRDAISVFAIDAMNKEQNEKTKEMVDDAISEGGEWADLLSGLQGLTQDLESFNSGLEKMNQKMDAWVIKNGGYVFDPEQQIWDAERSRCMASPFPDYFHGLTADWRGRGDEAVKYYSRALSNPYFPRGSTDFSFLAEMTYEDLMSLSISLRNKQAFYEGRMAKDPFYFQEDVAGWNPRYLISLGDEELRKENPDELKAQRYYEAAAHSDPFWLGAIQKCVEYFSSVKNAQKTEYWLKEFLRLNHKDNGLAEKYMNLGK